MVSLINFKSVDDELCCGERLQQQQQQQQADCRSGSRASKQIVIDECKEKQNLEQQQQVSIVDCKSVNSSSTNVVNENQQLTATFVNESVMHNNIRLASENVLFTNNSNKKQANETNLSNKQTEDYNNTSNNNNNNKGDNNKKDIKKQEAQNANFVVTWRNLKFCIKQKWHEKLLSIRSQSTNAYDKKQQVGQKLVLDRLDGSFKSGELTAILGPSGAGKTTLLDCLTGHRKSGLSGTIKISASCPPVVEQHQQQQQQQICSLNVDDEFQSVNYFHNRDNLKVSIIPQNDHLIGHLTVYETLNYASKMKNCSQKNFNHKFNIQRVAQQLGLMSCLATRINKLSGGQYKRVSIAQELLSNPDILILDEPTSGLDAMTCYQTVEVLRKLAEQRQLNGHNQIAVILTIHQPNSDVFQQFNHVYVVAQGGKCIYEGSPLGIESVINRVGLELPSSSYNQATIIVEIAAGKFGLDVVEKLNTIQKKQYECVSAASSTASSSIASSSSSIGSCSSSINDDADDNDDDKHNSRLEITDSNNNAGDNNNVDVLVVGTKKTAFVNEGFVDEQTFCPEIIVDRNQHDLSNVNNNNNKSIKLAQTLTLDNKSTSLSLTSSSSSINFVRSTGARDCTKSTNKPNKNHRKRITEKRLKLNSSHAEQKFPFWSHTYLHFHRSWISILRDPLLCGMQLFLHISVPLMVSLVYGTEVGKPNACPRAGPLDIMAYALDPDDSALNLQQEVRTTLENIGYIFFKLYGIIFAAMTVTVLTFPLDMHVLVKEFRNGWYGLSSYFLGRTLADIPFQLTLPFLAMSLSYYATGQPYSYMQWRFLSITGILILSSLIAQSQGLLFGAILMDRVKAAVFVAPAATTPIILFAGFLVRTQSIPHYLRPLSNISYLRYAIEACLISRYGFNQCECDPAVFQQQVPELPPIARTMLDYWLSNFRQSTSETSDTLPTTLASNSTSLVNSTESTTLETMSSQQPDLFNKLIDSLARANSFGRNITTCEQVVPYPMIDYDLKDSQLFDCFAVLLGMLVFTRLLTFFIVSIKVKRKV